MHQCQDIDQLFLKFSSNAEWKYIFSLEQAEVKKSKVKTGTILKMWKENVSHCFKVIFLSDQHSIMSELQSEKVDAFWKILYKNKQSYPLLLEQLWCRKKVSQNTLQ